MRTRHYFSLAAVAALTCGLGGNLPMGAAFAEDGLSPPSRITAVYRVDLGSFGFHKTAASSGGVYGAADYFITGTWQEADGFRDHSEGHSTRGAMNVGYRLSQNLETRFYLNANHVRQEIPGAVIKSAALTDPKAAAAVNAKSFFISPFISYL